MTLLRRTLAPQELGAVRPAATGTKLVEESVESVTICMTRGSSVSVMSGDTRFVQDGGSPRTPGLPNGFGRRCTTLSGRRVRTASWLGVAPTVLFDVGAHFGLFSLAALHYGPSSLCVAIGAVGVRSQMLRLHATLIIRERRLVIRRAAPGAPSAPRHGGRRHSGTRLLRQGGRLATGRDVTLVPPGDVEPWP